MIANNLKLVESAWQKQSASVDVRARLARDEMMTALIQLSKDEIQGRRPEGQKATAGKPPMNRSGDLRRSIIGVKSKTGFNSYSAIVGPTAIYGRAVEMGGKYAPRSWQGTSAVKGFPYMEPAFAKFNTHIRGQIVTKYFGKGM